MRILVSNDDGVDAPGIRILAEGLRGAGHEVWVVAPDRDRSGASNSLTLDLPIRTKQLDPHTIRVNGTPTDCVHLALTGMLDFDLFRNVVDEAGLDQPVHDRVEARLGEVQEGLLDAQVRSQRLRRVDERRDRGGRARVAAAVGKGDECGSSHQELPLSSPRVGLVRSDDVLVMSGFRTRSCWCRPSGRCAGPRREPRGACRASSRWRGSRRTRAG